MLRYVALASLLAPTTLACARAPSIAHAAAPAPEPQPLAVSYRVLRTEVPDAVMMSGRTDVDARHSARVEASAAHSAAGERLDLVARPREDGSVLVEVDYQETSAEGARLHWSPAVRLTRGAAARAEVGGSGWGRVIELTVQ
jgi:hypothetical protein